MSALPIAIGFPTIPRGATGVPVASLRKLALRGLFALLALLLGGGGYIGYLTLSGNIHEVIPGELYRSAQPDGETIAAYARRYGIKSILNLRGENGDADWYREELAASRSLGIAHFDFRMSSKRALNYERSKELLAMMRAARKPLLIHCMAGSDRTGLASVLYLQQIAGTSEDEAEGQLSLRFGHLGIPFLSKAYAMDQSWERLERHFGLRS